MIEQETLSLKQELVTILQDIIKTIEDTPEQDISKEKMRLLIEDGIGYSVTNDQFRLWAVKKLPFNKSESNDSGKN